MGVGYNAQTIARRKLYEERRQAVQINDAATPFVDEETNKQLQDAIIDIGCESRLKEAAANVVHVVFVEGELGLRFECVRYACEGFDEGIVGERKALLL